MNRPHIFGKRSVFVLFVFFSLLLSSLLLKPEPATGQQNKITIFHTNDVHGAFDSCYTSEGKLIQIGADVIKSLKSSTPNSILVDAGDSTQGGMLASSSQGSKIIELMNAAGYDVMALGNHEFDYGVDVLRLNATLADFKMLSANVYNEDNEPLMKSEKSNGCNHIMEVNGKKLGFFGITTCDSKHTTHPKNVESIDFRDEINAAISQTQYLKQQNVDLIICIAHIGNAGSGITAEKLATKVPGIDIIIDGHSHEVYSKTVGHTFIQQSGAKSKNIGKIEIEFQENNNFVITNAVIKSASLINPLDSNAHQYIPDQKISKMCRDMMKNASQAYKTIIGKTDSCLYGGEYQGIRICRLQDTNLGNLIGDALVKYGETFMSKSGISQHIPIVSLQNGGGVRTSILPKFISVGDVTNVFPFPNKISIRLATPQQLYSILENGFKSIHIENGILKGPDGAFPNVGGMRIEYDIDGDPLKFNEEKDKILSPGSRIKKIVTIKEDGSDNTLLDPNDNETRIAIVTNNFETSGGDQYITLKDLPCLTDEGDFLKDALCDYIKFMTFKKGEIADYPVTLSRVKLLNSENLFDKNYDITIKIKENSAELVNETVNIQIDDNDPITENTNEKGIVSLKELSQGPHNIKVIKGSRSMSAFVNNMIGIKSADIFLENTTDQDINDIVNIINGIPDQKISHIKEYVAFARNAYESLPEESKPLVVNYKSLLNAENANIALNSNVKQTINLDNFASIGLILLLTVMAYAIVNWIRQNPVVDKK